MSQQRSVTLCGHTLDGPAHICAFFESREEQYDCLLPYLAEGIAEGDRVISVVDGAQLSDHFDRMRSAGIPVEPALLCGSLRVMASEDTYTVDGSFGAKRMFEMLRIALTDARRDGWRVRTAGFMDWSYRGYAGTDELVEYEARVNLLLPTFQCTCLCVYDLERLNGRTLMEVLATHPYVLHGRRLVHNVWYRPVLELLEERGRMRGQGAVSAGGPSR
jgi:hypothetical protein